MMMCVFALVLYWYIVSLLRNVERGFGAFG